MTPAQPPEYAALLERAGELTDLRRLGSLLVWDQGTMMPASGSESRAHQFATLERVSHARLTDPELGGLLDALRPWAQELSDDAIERRAVDAMRRDHDKAVRVPADLAADMAHAGAVGEHAWMEARAANDFSKFRDALARQVELRRRYSACFPEAAHPYDVLLDDYEPGLTIADVRTVFSALRDGLVPLVAAARAGDDGGAGALAGHFPADRQRVLVTELLEAHGFDAASWRLDPTIHPFALSLGVGDTRLTTHYDESALEMAVYSSLHEFGHGLYEAGIDPALTRTPLGNTTSLGVHESQSRLWENIIGRSRPFCGWLAPRLVAAFPDQLDGLDGERLFRDTTRVRPSLIRIQADETTYNLHVVLRTDIETRLFSGELEVDALPEAWDAGMHELLGVEVPDAAQGVLQDIHWGVGLMGYFPTYAIGNIMSAQLWTALRRDLPGVDEDLAAGDTSAVREWLRERVHRHGRRYASRELLRRITGEELSVDPLLAYLRDKLADAGHLTADPAHG